MSALAIALRHGSGAMRVPLRRCAQRLRRVNVAAFKEDEQRAMEEKQQAPSEEKLMERQQAAPIIQPARIRQVNDMLAEMQRAMDAMTSDLLPGMGAWDDDMFFPRGFGLRTRGGRGLFPRGLGLLSEPASELEMDTSWALNPMEVEETDSAYCIRAEVPGFGKEDIKVTMSPDGILTMTAEHKEESKAEEPEGGAEEKAPATSSIMRSARCFRRSFRLPKDVATEDISATAKDGILSVHVPKKAREEPPPAKEIPVA